MSFSATVKKEVYMAAGGDRHCRIALLSALINGAARVRGAERVITLKTDNTLLARKFYDIIKDDFGVKCKAVKRETATGKVWELTVCGAEDTGRILHATGLETSEAGYTRRISALVVKSVCCRRAYLAGTLLACGSLSNPKKTYHCEIAAGDSRYTAELAELMVGFGLAPRQVMRKGRYALYFKDGEQISEMLRITGAHKALMRFENVRVLKDMGNRINRSVNCDTSNLDKAISAAVKQMESINTIKDAIGLDSLSKELAELALARLDYPEVSMKELGEKLNPPVGKSGVSHRMRRIHALADKLQSGEHKKERISYDNKDV